jgi:hypothetical protein
MIAEPAERPWLVHHVAVATLLALALWTRLAPAFSDASYFIQLDGERVTIQDFASHATVARAFWRGEGGYDAASHLRVTSQWAGQDVRYALPFGYSPTMLWILGPICFLGLRWAYVVWTLASAAAIVWMTRPARSMFLVSALVALSPVALAALANGQTSLLSTAGLLFLALDRSADDSSRAWRRSLPAAMVLWALTAKPPIAICAGAALLAVGRRRVVAAALAMTVASTVALIPWIGTDWIADYLYLMRHYDLQSADRAFVWSLHPEQMGNLRGVLQATFSLADDQASRQSSVVWLLATGAIVVGGMMRRLSPSAVWSLAVLAFLAFCPHVSFTELPHLVVPLALTALGMIERPFWARATLVVGSLAVGYLPPELNWGETALRPIVVWGVQLAIIAAILAGQRFHHDGAAIRSKNASSVR